MQYAADTLHFRRRERHNGERQREDSRGEDATRAAVESLYIPCRRRRRHDESQREEGRMSREVERVLETKRADARERVRMVQEREAGQKEEARRVSKERADARTRTASTDLQADAAAAVGDEFADDERAG